MKVAAALGILLALSAPAVLADAGELERLNAKLERYMELMHFEEMIAKSQRQCVDSALTGPGSPSGFAERGKPYWGLTPSFPEWAQLEVAYGKYVEDLCSYIDPKVIKREYIAFYAERLSEADLDAQLAFLDTSAGQALLASAEEANSRLQDYYVRSSATAVSAAYARFEREAERLQQQSQRHQPWWRFW